MAENTTEQMNQRNVKLADESDTQAVKYLIWVAGAAAIAVLTFMGQIVSNEATGLMSDITVMVPSLYAFGCAACIGAISPMIVNWHFLVFLSEHSQKKKIGHILTWIQHFSLPCGWLLFAWGLYSAGQAFEGLQKVAST